MMPESWAVAEVILTPEELERHPEYVSRRDMWALADRKSCNAYGSMHLDKGMSSAWLKAHGVNVSPRRWVREDFLEAAARIAAAPTPADIPF
jgi:hypothetical protein